jgi:hypothetical protein
MHVEFNAWYILCADEIASTVCEYWVPEFDFAILFCRLWAQYISRLDCAFGELPAKQTHIFYFVGGSTDAEIISVLV